MAGDSALQRDSSIGRNPPRLVRAIEKPLVLLIDPSSRTLETRAFILRREGYAVTEIEWLADLFEYLRAGPRAPFEGCPDLIAADVDGFSGRVVLKLLTDLKKACPETRLILLASEPAPALYRKIEELGSVHLLEKPCTEEAVRDLALSLVRPG